MKLSILIVNWNTCDLLAKCLESVFHGTNNIAFEVIVVDNASKDGSAQMVRERFPQVHLIQNPKNVGFARGNNLALQKSSGEYILLLNSDTEIFAGSIDILMRFLDANSDVGAVGPRLLNSDGSLQESCYPKPTLSREFWRLFHLDRLYPLAIYPMQEWSLERPREVDVLMGACLLLRREVVDQIGLFDEDYFMYSEEVDLCLRIQRAGWKMTWVPQSKVIHHEGQSTKQMAEEMFLQLYRGKVLYFRKHYGRIKVFFYKWVIFLATLVRLLLTPLALIEPKSRRKQHLALSGHYRQLLVTLPSM